MKYTGTFLMDDTGIKEQQMVADKLRVELAERLGPGQLNTNFGIDNLRELNWSWVTDSDETPAPHTELEKVADLQTSLDDPATREIAEERVRAEEDAGIEDAGEGLDLEGNVNEQQGQGQKAKT